MESRRHQPGEVRHVDDELCADLFRDFRERLEFDDARVSARAGNDHLGLLLARDALHGGVVDATVVADAIMNRVVQQAGEIDRRAVGEMAAL